MPSAVRVRTDRSARGAPPERGSALRSPCRSTSVTRRNGGLTRTVTLRLVGRERRDVRPAISLQLCSTACVRRALDTRQLCPPSVRDGLRRCGQRKNRDADHVDRSPSRRRTSLRPAWRACSRPDDVDRFDPAGGVELRLQITTRPSFILQCLRKLCARNTSGPQSWCGEIESTGPGPRRDRGPAYPRRPLPTPCGRRRREEYVFATSPRYRTTWPAVALKVRLSRLLVVHPEIHLLRVSGRDRRRRSCASQRVRACDNGLCLQRLRKPREGHPEGNDAVEGTAQPDHVDRAELSGGDIDLIEPR